MQLQSSQPQKATPCTKTHHTTYRSLRSVHPFFAKLILTQPPKSYALQCFSIGQTPQKCPLLKGRRHPHVMHVSWTHPTQHFKLHLDQFSCFAQLTAQSPYTLQCALKHD